ncbi:MAG: PepSY domain-containing protein [Cytophagaceae bacterium]|nr:PepSY domain-containing protein [Gemmatimonadaceae bacterium]
MTFSPIDGSSAARARTRPRPPRDARATISRFSFHAHLWLGVVSTIALLVIGVTGILLNHKRPLGLMPDVPNEPTAPFIASLSLAQVADIALAEVAGAGTEPANPVTAIDRMDVRPRDGLVKVRMRDASSTEVTVDLGTGKVLHVGPRGDVFLEKLHSGEVFGGPYILLSDFAAVALVITLISGYWLWLAPKLRRPAGSEEGV